MVDTSVYAARIKDTELLAKSSSGGMVTVLIENVLKKGGAVACTVYNYVKQQAEFKLITSTKECDAVRGSKYMQSITGNIFLSSVEWLNNNENKPLLFIGTGCQAAGFKKFIENKGYLSRIIVVDIICHGVPSLRIWKDFIGLLEKKYGGEVDYVTFKDKRVGWKKPTAFVKINEKEVMIKEYVKIFYNHSALRPSCYKCPYASIKRDTDITIGDYWGIEKVHPEFYDSMGNSLILIHSQKGRDIFEECKEFILFKESNEKVCLQPNLIKPTPISSKREEFWNDYQLHDISYMIKKYGSDSFLRKVTNRLRKIIQ